MSYYYQEGSDINNPNNFQDFINKITIQDIQIFTKNIIESSKSYKKYILS